MIKKSKQGRFFESIFINRTLFISPTKKSQQNEFLHFYWLISNSIYSGVTSTFGASGVTGGVVGPC